LRHNLRRTCGLGGVEVFLGKKKINFFNPDFDHILHYFDYILYYNNIQVFTAFVRKLLKNIYIVKTREFIRENYSENYQE